MGMYLLIMVLSISLLTAFNVFGAQNDNSPTFHLITSAPISVPYQSSFSSYKPYVQEELSSWRALNKQVTGGGTADHSKDNMKSMDHNKMQSMPSGHAITEMEGMPNDTGKLSSKELSKPAHQH